MNPTGQGPVERAFDRPESRLLIVANKFQTGFDQEETSRPLRRQAARQRHRDRADLLARQQDVLRQGQGLRRRLRERPRDGSRRLQDLRRGRDDERGPGPERRLRPEGRPRRGRRVRDARRRGVQGGALQVQGPRSRRGERWAYRTALYSAVSRARRDLPREVRGGQGLLRDLAGVRQPGGGGRRGRGGERGPRGARTRRRDATRS